MKISRRGFISLLFISVVLWPSIAMADMIFPPIFFVWSGMVFFFLPIIAIEACVARSTLDLPWYRALHLSFIANLVSTLFGFPISLIWQFILPWIDTVPILKGHSILLIPLGLLSLCIPLFFATVWIETKVAFWFLPKEFHSKVRQWSLLANLASYALIAVVLGYFIIISLCSYH